jgi:hypothetical protein
MSKFLKIGLIEFKQQSRRKAVWIGVLAGLLYNIYQDLVCLHMGLNVFIDNDITISNSAARLSGMTLFILLSFFALTELLKIRKSHIEGHEGGKKTDWLKNLGQGSDDDKRSIETRRHEEKNKFKDKRNHN